VHALESLHAALRPLGLVLDVRPAPEHPTVAFVPREVGGVQLPAVRLGQLDDTFRIGTQATADAALHALIDAGQMVRERTETFTFVYHFDSITSWLTYLAEHWSTARISDALTAHAQAKLAAASGEVQVLRTMQISRLRRG
jgi:hypothetical protein